MRIDKSIFIGLTALLTIFIIGCSSETGPRNAQYLTLAELRVTPGFEWFDEEYNNYKPDTSIIEQIKIKLQDNTDEYILYVNPSCNCTGTQKEFPSAVKILHESGIDEPTFKIYSMYSEADNHPHQMDFKVMDLPSFFSLRNSTPFYSMMDSLTYYRKIDPDTEWKLEEFVLRAL